MFSSRDLLVVCSTLVVAAVVGAGAILLVLPSVTSIPFVVLIGSVVSTTLAPIINYVVVNNILIPVKVSQGQLHNKVDAVDKKVDRIEKDVNSTATEMARRLEEIRVRNVKLESDAAASAQRGVSDDATTAK